MSKRKIIRISGPASLTWWESGLLVVAMIIVCLGTFTDIATASGPTASSDGVKEGSPVPSHTIVRNPGPVRNASVDGLVGTGLGEVTL